MEKVHTNLTVSITEFKKNPNDVLEQAAGQPFVVLTNNKPSFYVLTPEVFEALGEEAIEEALWEVEATPDLLDALEDVRNGNVVDVDINDLKVD
jgi:antitoxin StbD